MVIFYRHLLCHLGQQRWLSVFRYGKPLWFLNHSYDDCLKSTIYPLSNPMELTFLAHGFNLSFFQFEVSSKLLHSQICRTEVF